MARTFLRLTDNEFWDMAPRTLFCMIAEWNEIEDYRAMIQAMANNGQELPSRTKPHEPEEEQFFYVDPDCF